MKRLEANKSQTVINSDESGSLVSWKFNQNRLRESLVKMLILDELPFRCVEREGFILFMKEAQPLFKIPSRHAIREDCVKMYLTQRMYLRNFFGLNGLGRVSLTTDSWTSCNNTNFICVTAHCIDSSWNLHKKIIGFSKIYSHRGDDLASAIATILDDWGLKRLFCCTLDNAATNYYAIREMTTRFVERNMLLAGGQYFHLRCVGHILNLVVEEGLAEIGMSVRRVGEAVKWIKASPARSESFKETAKLYKVETSKFLCLDVPTRWNSTYLMLESALPYAPVMAIFERVNTAFVRDLKQKTYNKIPIGVPEELDWHEVRRMCGYLKKFHKLTEEVSGTTYPTSYTFFKEMCSIFTVIRRLEGHENEDIKRMATSMKSKLGKYWLEDEELNPKMNKIMYIAAMLDPRQKMKHVQLCLKTVYGDRRAAELVEMLNKSMYDLFELYQSEMNANSNQPPTPRCTTQTNVPVDEDGYEELQLSSLVTVEEEEEDEVPDRSELTLYFTEKQYKMNIVEVNNFDILQWWKLKTPRYPVLSEMAKDLLAIPASSVASESAFSMGGVFYLRLEAL